MTMQTRLLSPDAAGIDEAARLLRQGELVAIPTETVYGLAADAMNPAAVAAIFAAMEDFKSPNGHNFIADYNYYVMPADVFDAVKDAVPYGVGVLCPDGGHLRCVRKAVRKDRTRPVSEMLLMLWRSSRREIVGRRNKNDKETNDRQD